MLILTIYGGEKAMKKLSNMLGIAVIIMIVGAIIFFCTMDQVGANGSKIEVDARKTLSVDDSWLSTQDVSKAIAAFIFYDKEKLDYQFSIYTKGGILTCGYFFTSGGCTGYERDGVANYRSEHFEESVYISLNKQHIVNMVITNGNATETVDINESTPFVFILPNTLDNVAFLDSDGNKIDIIVDTF